MKLIYDTHTHTNYSHGENSIEEMVVAAIEHNLTEIHITEHGKNHHYAKHLNYKKYKEMYDEIVRLRKVYPNIKIVFGVEANIISTKGDIDVSKEEQELFEDFNVGFHCLCKLKNISSFFKIHVLFALAYKLKLGFLKKASNKYCTEAMLQALDKYPIHMITHPTSNYRFDILKVAKKCAQTGTILEINDSRKKLSVEDVKKIKDLPIKIAVGSDAHSTRRVGSCKNAFEIIHQSGLSLDKVINVE